MTNTIQQPRPFDIVGDPVLIAGIAQGFEAVVNWRVHEGHDERTGFFNVGGGTGEHGQFQVQAAIGNAAFQLDRLFVEVFEQSAQDGSEINKVVVPVIYGPRIVPRLYRFSHPHGACRRNPVGDRQPALWRSKQARADPAANPVEISNPNLIFVGQKLKVPIGA